MAMNWDKTTPAGSGALSQGDDEIRDMKEELENALQANTTEGVESIFPGSDPTNPVFRYRGLKGTTAARPTSGQYGLYFDTDRQVLQRDNGTSWEDIAQLVVNASIDENKLAASVAGNGLAGGAGTVLSVNVDDSTIEINSDSLRVKAGGIGNSHIATNAIQNSNMADNSVDSAEIVDGSVDSVKINPDRLIGTWSNPSLGSSNPGINPVALTVGTDVNFNYTTGTNEFDIPATGVYMIGATFTYSGATRMAIYIEGSRNIDIYVEDSDKSAGFIRYCSKAVYLTAAETFHINADFNSAGSGTSGATGDLTGTFHITRIS